MFKIRPKIYLGVTKICRHIYARAQPLKSARLQTVLDDDKEEKSCELSEAVNPTNQQDPGVGSEENANLGVVF